MKKTAAISAIFAALAVSAQATTVLMGGGPASAMITPFYLSDGVTPVATTFVRVGTFTDPNDLGTFQEFGADGNSVEIKDPLPQVPPQSSPGQLVGQVQDNSAAADAFNGDQIYIWVYNGPSEAESTEWGIFSATEGYTFPNNLGGVGDSIALNPSNINVALIGTPGTGPDDPHRLAVIPEASALSLGAIGLLFILGRRRRRA